MPADPRVRFRTTVLFSAWMAVQSEIYAMVPQPRSEIDGLDAAAVGLDHTQLSALAANVRGRWLVYAGLPAEARASFDTAIQATLQIGDDRNAAMLMLQMADSYVDSGQIQAASHWTKLAEGVTHHLGDPPDLASQLAGEQAREIEHSPKAHEAAALRRKQVELSRKAWDDRVDRVIDQEHLAYAARDDDDPVAMQRAVDDGIKLIEANFGIDHYMMIRFESFRTMAAMRAGKLDDAERYARHAIALADRWYGGDTNDAIEALQNLGAILQRKNDIAGMMQATERALAAALRVDPDSEDVGHLEGNVGIAYASMGDFATAGPHLVHATAIVEHLLGSDADPLNDLYVRRARVEALRRVAPAARARDRDRRQECDDAGESADRAVVHARVDASRTGSGRRARFGRVAGRHAGDRAADRRRVSSRARRRAVGIRQSHARGRRGREVARCVGGARPGVRAES
jgi:hypothetical protein